MIQDEIIEMAKQAGLDPDLWNYTDAFETFAHLVAAKERNRAWEKSDWTEYEHSIAAKEREACAKIAEEWLGLTKDRELHIAAAIRARTGEQK